MKNAPEKQGVRMLEVSIDEARKLSYKECKELIARIIVNTRHRAINERSWKDEHGQAQMLEVEEAYQVADIVLYNCIDGEDLFFLDDGDWSMLMAMDRCKPLIPELIALRNIIKTVKRVEESVQEQASTITKFYEVISLLSALMLTVCMAMAVLGKESFVDPAFAGVDSFFSRMPMEYRASVYYGLAFGSAMAFMVTMIISGLMFAMNEVDRTRQRLGWVQIVTLIVFLLGGLLFGVAWYVFAYFLFDGVTWAMLVCLILVYLVVVAFLIWWSITGNKGAKEKKAKAELESAQFLWMVRGEIIKELIAGRQATSGESIDTHPPNPGYGSEYESGNIEIL